MPLLPNNVVKRVLTTRWPTVGSRNPNSHKKRNFLCHLLLLTTTLLDREPTKYNGDISVSQFKHASKEKIDLVFSLYPIYRKVSNVSITDSAARKVDKKEANLLLKVAQKVGTLKN